jgi:RNA binding exosome subunit
MRKVITLTESDLTRIVKRVIKENYMDSAARSAVKTKGYSHRSKDDTGEFYIVFDGNKFYEGDFEIADYNDMGEIPRVENGKLIIAHPYWES